MVFSAALTVFSFAKQTLVPMLGASIDVTLDWDRSSFWTNLGDIDVIIILVSWQNGGQATHN